MQRLLVAISLWLIAGCGVDSRTGRPSEADRFPRLTHAQWEATVADLFGWTTPVGLAVGFTPDPQLGRFDNNIARLGLSGGLWRDYQTAAEAIAARVVADPAALAVAAPPAVASDPPAFVAGFGLRAFRRPLTPTEVERYAALFASAAARYPQHDAFTAGVRLVIEGMLQSPHFLYRTELSDVVVEGGLPLGGFEVAARLSYLLWNTMPDGELLEAAARGELDDAAGVTAQALRLLDDPRAAAQLRRFHYQAFGIAEYADLDKDTAVFPAWRRELGAMMQEETLRFVDDVVASGGGIAELLTSTRAFVNADLARVYGVPGTFGTDYAPVDLDPATRAGLLTRAGFLARNATLRESDPIHRGVFINLNLLCRTIATPPTLPSDLMPSGTTTRERVTSITGEGTCGAGCHATMINPVGFAFEHYDAVGSYRTTEHGAPINATDRYLFADGRAIEFTNAVELSQQLAASPEVHACYASQLLEFILGRDLRPLDQLVVGDLAARSLSDRLAIRDVVLSVVASKTFRVRTIVKGVTP